MRVVGALGRASARGRTPALVGLAAVVALGAGAALGALAIAARTDRAYPDHLGRAEVAEVVINPSLPTERAEEIIAATDGVLSYATDDLLLATFDDGAPRTQSEVDSEMTQVRMSSDGRYLRQDRPVVQEGRLPREDAREAFLGRGAADALGVAVGDTLPFAFWEPSYNTGAGAAQDDLVEPVGHSSATVVGIGLFADEVLPDGLFPQERVLVTPAVGAPFTCTYGDPAALGDVDLQTAFAEVVPASCSFSYRFFSIQTDGDLEARRVVDALTAAFQAENEGIPEVVRSEDVGYVVIPAFAAQERERIDQALAPTVTALRAFGWGAAVATLVLALLQALRWMRRLGPEVAVWRSLGVARGERTLVLALPLLLAVSVGLAGAVLVGWVASSFGAAGSAAAIDPDGPGIPLDVAAGAVLAVAGTLLLLLAGIAAVAAGNPRPRPDRPGLVRRLLERLEPARASGVRAALRGAGSGAVVGGSTAAVAVVLATGVFSANVTELIGEPARYGWPYDVAVLVGFGYGGADVDAIGESLDTEEVEAWGSASLGTMTIDGQSVPAVAARSGLEQLGTPVTSGRLPEADDEIALGRSTFHDLGVEIGDEVALSSYYGDRLATVTGTVVLPGIGPYESDRASSGTGAWLSTAFFEALVGAAEEDAGIPAGSLLSTADAFIGIDLAEGVDPEAFLAARDLLAWDVNRFASPTYPDPVLPADLVELDDMRRVPIALGAVFAAAMAIGLALGVAAAARARRVELATLRAVGLTPRQLARSVRWQALTTIAVATIIGVPLGVAAGRALARRFLADLGVDPQVVTPVLFVVAVALGALLIAEIASALPARRTARTRLTVPRDA